jgi:hypothetical protein
MPIDNLENASYAHVSLFVSGDNLLHCQLGEFAPLPLGSLEELMRYIKASAMPSSGIHCANHGRETS